MRAIEKEKGPASLKPGDTIGDYRLLQVIGAGGMGQVFQSEHLITGRLEAFKVVLKETADAPDIGARFLREIRVHASLNHPNIVSVYNAFWVGEELAMVMEWVDGEPLDSLLKLGPMPLSRAVDLTGQTLLALNYAHSRGVTHRDVSPHNILISSRGAVKLMDFGLAVQPTDVRLTQSGVPVGSLAYMAPEQVRNGADADFRSDLYSVGVVLYQMLTGRRPFNSENGFEIMRAHIEQTPPPVRQWANHIPQAVEDVVMRALSKDPNARFASADEFRHALMAAAAPPASSVPMAPAHQDGFYIPLPPSFKTPLIAALCGVLFVSIAFAVSRMLTGRNVNPPPPVEAVVEEADPAAERGTAPQRPGGRSAAAANPDELRAGPSAEHMVRAAPPAPEKPRPVRPQRKAEPAAKPAPAQPPPAQPVHTGPARVLNLENRD